MAEDRALVTREGELPGLALVLDPAAVADLVGAVTGRDARPLAATHARYKPGTSCVVGHRLLCDGAEVLCAAKAYRRGDVDKLDKALRKAVPDPRAGWGVVVSRPLSVVVSTLVNDRDLPALPLLDDPARRAALLGRLAGSDGPTGGAFDIRTVRHKPERRWVGTVEAEGLPLLRLKAYRTSDVGRAHAAHQVMADRDLGPVGWSRRRGVVAGRWVDGRSMAELLARGDPSCVGAVGERLAELHRRPGDSRLRTLRASHLRGAVRAAADGIAALDPDLARRAGRVARRAARSLPDEPAASLVHGDFSADQVVCADDEVRLIDFDESRNGDPAVDLASFAADLRYADLDGRLGIPAEGVVEDLVAAYLDAGGTARPEDLGPHLAGALLRRAVLAFRERRPGWTATCHGMVDAATDVLRSGPVPR